MTRISVCRFADSLRPSGVARNTYARSVSRKWWKAHSRFFFSIFGRVSTLFDFPFSDGPKPTSHAHMAGDRPPRKRRLPRVTRQLLGDGIRKQLRHRWVRIPTRARSGRENTRSFSVVPAHECAEFKESRVDVDPLTPTPHTPFPLPTATTAARHRARLDVPRVSLPGETGDPPHADADVHAPLVRHEPSPEEDEETERAGRRSRRRRRGERREAKQREGRFRLAYRTVRGGDATRVGRTVDSIGSSYSKKRSVARPRRVFLISLSRKSRVFSRVRHSSFSENALYASRTWSNTLSATNTLSMSPPNFCLTLSGWMITSALW